MKTEVIVTYKTGNMHSKTENLAQGHTVTVVIHI